MEWNELTGCPLRDVLFCDASDSFGEVLLSLGRDLNDEAKA
jgi:hypothetical protein